MMQAASFRRWYRLPSTALVRRIGVTYEEIQVQSLMSERDLYLRRFSDPEFMEHSCAEQHASCSKVTGKDIRLFSDDAIGHTIALYHQVSAQMKNDARNRHTKLQMAVVFQLWAPRWLCHCNVRSEEPNALFFYFLYHNYDITTRLVHLTKWLQWNDIDT